MAKGAIDCWINTPTKPIPLESMDEAMQRGISFLKSDWLTKGLDVKDVLKEMDANGIEKAVLGAVDVRGEPWRGRTNEETAKYAKEYPDRFIGCASIDPRRGMPGVAMLEKYVNQYGLRGLRIFDHDIATPVNDRIYYPYYAKCCELGIPVCLVMGHAAGSWPSAMGRPILIDDVAIYFPDLKIIANHLGWPWMEEMIAMAWKHPNVYIALDSYSPKHFKAELITFMTKFGQDKVIYGSNHPWVPLGKHHSEFMQIPMPEDVRMKILRDNALKIWKE